MQTGTLLTLVSCIVAFALAGCVDTAGAGAEPGTAGGGKIQAAPPPEEDTGQIVGVVTDDEFQAVEGAEVGLLSTTPPLSTTTDATGAFVVLNVPPGTHQVAVQRLGYESAGRTVDVSAGARSELNLILKPLPAVGELRQKTLQGDGYFSCGAQLRTPVYTLSWGNLHACVFDDHKPRFTFTTTKQGWFGILQEVSWKQSTALTSQSLQVYLQYKPACTPFCSAEKQYAAGVGKSPIRNYVDVFEKEGRKFTEDPVELASMTFPQAESNPGVVVVFQQRMTHYITQYWGGHWDQEFSAVPDA